MLLSKVHGLCCNCRNVEMSKQSPLCVKKPVPEWPGFTTRAFDFAGVARTHWKPKQIRPIQMYGIIFDFVSDATKNKHP